MNRSFATFAALLVVSAVFSVRAADHGDAPLMGWDIGADIADTYAFRSPNDASMLVLALDVNPMSSPSDNTKFHFAEDVSYEFRIDNNGDAVADHVITFLFNTRNPGVQSFRAALPTGDVIGGLATPPSVERQPNDPNIITGPDGIRAFAGQRDDPFFFDVVGFSRFMAGTGSFSGIDGLAGLNVSAIVLEIPLSSVLGPTGEPLQIWATTSRRRVTTRDSSLGLLPRHRGPLQQVERTGNPLVNRDLIPAESRDLFNIAEPVNDQENFSDALLTTLVSLGTSSTNIETLQGMMIPDTLKLDVAAPDGYPNGRRLEDDVIDTVLFLVFNGTVTDRVDANDMAFGDTFPYMAAPHQPE